MSGGEQIEAFQQLQMEERQARKDGSLTTTVKQLRGGSITHNATLPGMMGDLCDTEQKVKDALQEKRLHLKAHMKSDDEIDNIVRQECMAMASGKRVLCFHSWNGTVKKWYTEEKRQYKFLLLSHTNII